MKKAFLFTSFPILILFIISLILMGGCDDGLKQKGDYWSLNKNDMGEQLIFKGKKLGEISNGVIAFRTLEENWVLYRPCGLCSIIISKEDLQLKPINWEGRNCGWLTSTQKDLMDFDPEYKKLYEEKYLRHTVLK